MEYKSDFLVIGSGIAGLRFAHLASEFGTVNIITKKEKSESNTNYAQGGIASVLSSDDSYDLHIKDTLIAGAGLCNEKSVEFLVKNGPREIKNLLELGIEFSKSESGKVDLGREGGHSRNRIVHSKDMTGQEVEKFLLNLINLKSNIQLFENRFAIDLITEHNLPNSLKSQNKYITCFGAYVFDVNSNTVDKYLAKYTILATGGLGQAYLFTTNPLIATGDGFAMGFRAGALISNMEFIQFHPTSLWEQKKSNSQRSFLISEAVRGKGAILRLQDGSEFMQKYDKRKELAPRDIVARAIDNELKKSGEEYVFLDITNLNKNDIIYYFPNIYKKCLELNIDISKDFIPVVPSAHFSCGGIYTNLSGLSSIKNLIALGEVSMTGVHGANRLASNSLLEALVFSRSASEYCAEHIENIIMPQDILPDWKYTGTTTADEKILISQSRTEIRQILWDYVGIVRSNLRLDRAKKRISLIRKEVKFLYDKTKISEDILELRNLADVAYLIIHSALKRKESRGLHYNIDFLNILDSNPKNTYIQNRILK